MTQKTETELYEMLNNFHLTFGSEGATHITHSDIQDLVDQIKTIVDRNSSMNQVGEFMTTFNQKVRTYPEIPTPKECIFRLSLITEETFELAEACGSEVLSQ